MWYIFAASFFGVNPGIAEAKAVSSLHFDI